MAIAGRQNFMSKAKWCDDCVHVDVLNDRLLIRSTLLGPVANVRCGAEHKPNFYQPKSLGDAVHGRYGYKRVCREFDPILDK